MTLSPEFEYGGPLDTAASILPDARDNTGRWPQLETRLYNAFPGETVGEQEIVNPAAATILAVPAAARSALVQVQAAAVRCTFFGRAVTAASGLNAVPGDILTLTGPNALKGFQVINAGGGAATLYVVYFS